MPTNPYFSISENEKKLLQDLNAEARQKLKEMGWTDEQINAMPRAKKLRKPKGKK